MRTCVGAGPELCRSSPMIGTGKVIDRTASKKPRPMSKRRSVSSPRDRYLSAWLVIAGLAKLYLGSDTKAVTCFRRSIEINRNHPVGQFFLAEKPWRSWSQLEEARCAARAGLALLPDFTVSRFRAAAASDNPRYLAARGRLAD